MPRSPSLCPYQWSVNIPQQCEKPAPQPRPERKSGLYLLLQAARQHGITHPKDGYWPYRRERAIRPHLSLIARESVA